jgi:hypothetical protein
MAAEPRRDTHEGGAAATPAPSAGAPTLKSMTVWLQLHGGQQARERFREALRERLGDDARMCALLPQDRLSELDQDLVVLLRRGLDSRATVQAAVRSLPFELSAVVRSWRADPSLA